MPLCFLLLTSFQLEGDFACDESQIHLVELKVLFPTHCLFTHTSQLGLLYSEVNVLEWLLQSHHWILQTKTSHHQDLDEDQVCGDLVGIEVTFPQTLLQDETKFSTVVEELSMVDFIVPELVSCVVYSSSDNS